MDGPRLVTWLPPSQGRSRMARPWPAHHRRQGGRMARQSIRFASWPLMNRSRCGSHRSLRRRQMAMWLRWQTEVERRATSAGATV